MKKGIKILVCSVLLLGGVIGGQQKARAQFVVSDPTNLVQSILQYIMDQMREGNWDLSEGISKLQGMREEFKMNEERLDQVLGMVQKFQSFKNAYQDIAAIAEICKLVQKDISNFYQIQMMMSELGGYGGAALVDNLVQSYKKVTNSLTEDVKLEMFDLQKITQTDPMQMLSELRKSTEYLYSGYGIIRNTFYAAIRDAYHDEMRNRVREADQDLISMFIY